jgi:hypothetical protein
VLRSRSSSRGDSGRLRSSKISSEWSIRLQHQNTFLNFGKRMRAFFASRRHSLLQELSAAKSQSARYRKSIGQRFAQSPVGAVNAFMSAVARDAPETGASLLAGPGQMRFIAGAKFLRPRYAAI